MKASFCKPKHFCYTDFMKMKYINLFVAVVLVQSLASGVALARADQDDDENYSGYDSIIHELSASTHYKNTEAPKDPLDSVRFHLGVGMVSSRVSLDLPKGLAKEKSLHGFEARLGVDLFSPNWVAEGTVRSFDPEPFNGGQLSLKEFDLLLTYHFRPERPVDFTLGGGMAARYLEITGDTKGEFARSNSTPMSVLSFGILANITPEFNVGAEVSYRSTLVSDTIDDNSVDGGLRIGGRF